MHDEKSAETHSSWSWYEYSMISVWIIGTTYTDDIVVIMIALMGLGLV